MFVCLLDGSAGAVGVMSVGASVPLLSSLAEGGALLCVAVTLDALDTRSGAREDCAEPSYSCGCSCCMVLLFTAGSCTTDQ